MHFLLHALHTLRKKHLYGQHLHAINALIDNRRRDNDLMQWWSTVDNYVCKGLHVIICHSTDRACVLGPRLWIHVTVSYSTRATKLCDSGKFSYNGYKEER